MIHRFICDFSINLLLKLSFFIQTLLSVARSNFFSLDCVERGYHINLVPRNYRMFKILTRYLSATKYFYDPNHCFLLD
jgi:hypothetical protein